MSDDYFFTFQQLSTEKMACILKSVTVTQFLGAINLIFDKIWYIEVLNLLLNI